jgi:hypothetical protein
MAVSIGTSTFPNLTAQPFGYDEVDTRSGQTARKWTLSGLLKPTEWLSLLNTYNTWRNARINDEDSLESNTTGTTVALTATGPGGQTFTGIACWFSAAPSAEQSGRYLAVSVELVDASQSLAVLRKQQQAGQEALPGLGNYVLGTTTLKLLKPIDAYGPGPQLELTATGNHYITGPLVVQRIRDIEGTTDKDGWDAIRDWYQGEVVTVPARGDWYPIEPPTATAAIAIVNGVRITQYTISAKLGRVL